MSANLIRKPFKLVSEDRQTRKGVVVSNLEELIYKARTIFNLGPDNVQILLERDGTEILEDEFLLFLENFTDLVVVQSKCQKMTNCQRLDVCNESVTTEQEYEDHTEEIQTSLTEEAMVHYIVEDDKIIRVNDSKERERNFEIVSGGTDKGRDLLLDDMGYRYGIKAKSTSSVIWHCTARPGKTSTSAIDCRATVRQKNNVFSFGKRPHSCKRSPELNNAIKIRREIKERIDRGEAAAAEDAVKIVKEVMAKYRERNVEVPQESYLVRIGYRRLKKFREGRRPS